VKVSTEPLDNCQVALTIEVEPERVEQYLRRGARRLAQQVRIPGFRKGKAPYQVVVAMLGKDTIYNEILEDLINDAYREALSQTQLEPIDRAELEDVQIEPTVIRMRVPLPPKVKPGDYRSIRIEREEVEVSDEEVDEILEELRESRSRWVEVDRPAQYGDLLTVDIKGTVDGETLIDQTDWDFVPAENPEAELIPGFDAAFIGMKPGETREFTLTYPPDSNSRWAGKEAHFVATLKRVQEREAVELNDEFAASIGDFRTLEDLRRSIREGLKAERELEARSKDLEEVLDALVAGAEEISYPPILLEREIDDMIERQERQLRAQGMELEDYLRLNQMTREQYRESLRSQAERRLVRNLLLGAVAEAEGITVEPEEIEAEIARITQDLDEQAREGYQRILRTATGRQLIANDILTQKTLDRLLAIARGELEEAPEEAAEEGQEEAEAAEAEEPAAEVEAAASSAEAETASEASEEAPQEEAASPDAPEGDEERGEEAAEEETSEEAEEASTASS